MNATELLEIRRYLYRYTVYKTILPSTNVETFSLYCDITPPSCRPPAGGKTIYATRKIRSAVPRVNVPEKKEEVREVSSPSFEMTRTPTNIGVKVQIEDNEALER
jgi:hypothetical protein